MLKEYKDKVDASLINHLPNIHITPSSLNCAMHYAVMNGGKRIRPALAFAIGEEIGVNENMLLTLSCAIEFIHAFSLVHDDLPAIDDDDLRRGKPSCHKQFNESTAILAGDALHTLAFETLARLSDNNVSQTTFAQVISFFSFCVGSQGLIGGEQIDIEMEQTFPTVGEIVHMYSLKTARLIQASLLMPILVSDIGQNVALQKSVEKLGLNLGIAFQIHDDIIGIESSTEILGKPQGSDQLRDKAAIPLVIGLSEAKKLRTEYFNQAIEIINILPFDTKKLNTIARYIIERNY